MRKGVVAARAARSPSRIRTVQELWGSFTMCKPKLAGGAYIAGFAMCALTQSLAYMANGAMYAPPEVRSDI